MKHWKKFFQLIVLEWASQSPRQNPNKYLLQHLKVNVYSHFPSDLHELKLHEKKRMAKFPSISKAGIEAS